MKNLTLGTIAKVVSGTYHGPERLLDREIEGACLDSRLVRREWLFFATPGEKTDGHNFLGQVYEKGALCTITQRDVEKADLPEGITLSDVAYIRVSDSFCAGNRFPLSSISRADCFHGIFTALHPVSSTICPSHAWR